MHKFRLISIALIVALALLNVIFQSGCSSPERAQTGEYALIMEDTTYEIGTSPAANTYKDPSLEVRTFVNPEDQNEEVIFVQTSKSGETSRGVRIGDSLAALKAAYPEVVFLSGDGSWADDNAPVAYSRIYRFFVNGDGTNNFIDFYTDNSPERKVVLIEVANGLDAPREWNENIAWLGDEAIKKEMPDGFTTRLFRENKDGSETEIVVFTGAAESHELDEDGILEIVCFEKKNNTQGIVIYDKVGDRIIKTDVNTALGSEYSEYTGLIGNIKSEYSNCIETVLKKEDGSGENLIYSYKDGELKYLCALQDALR